MAVYTILKTCASCGGDGEHLDTVKDIYGNVTGTVKDCDRCGGDGKYDVGAVDLSDLEDKIDDIMDKCNDIFEALEE